jgi:hypothetical protein
MAELVVVLDNDAKSTHMPSRIQTLRVSRAMIRTDLRRVGFGRRVDGLHLPSEAGGSRLVS